LEPASRHHRAKKSEIEDRALPTVDTTDRVKQGLFATIGLEAHMRIEEIEKDGVIVRLSTDELMILNNALNEVCSTEASGLSTGVDSTRNSRDALLNEIAKVLSSTERTRERNQLMTKDDVLDALSRFKRERAAEYGITRIGVFGSFARNQAGKNSDVDVVFETASPNLFRIAKMQQELQRLFARSVDVIRFRDNMNPSLKARIAREALYV
jgi:uncharacterized protein